MIDLRVVEDTESVDLVTNWLLEVGSGVQQKGREESGMAPGFGVGQLTKIINSGGAAG